MGQVHKYHVGRKVKWLGSDLASSTSVEKHRAKKAKVCTIVEVCADLSYKVKMDDSGEEREVTQSELINTRAPRNPQPQLSATEAPEQENVLLSWEAKVHEATCQFMKIELHEHEAARIALRDVQAMISDISVGLDGLTLEGSYRERRRQLLKCISDLEVKILAATPAAASQACRTGEDSRLAGIEDGIGKCVFAASDDASAEPCGPSSAGAEVRGEAVHDGSAIRWRRVGYVKDKEVWFALGYKAAVCVPLYGDEADKVCSHLRHECVSATSLPFATAVPKAGQPVSVWIDHVVAAASRLVQSVAGFKIGITANPCERWRWYEREGTWSELILVAVHHNSTVIAMMEERLIAVLGGDARCANRAPGGEGEEHMHGPPYFAYVVVAR